ncbi:unnamed protein product [Durusdinium trenchii]|uniref:Rab-GAP TBC domain-containing protein n=1 Tax=Durusdinium trenchii TaxID=1381693 RepID=A0ABP0NUS8_9DINO
MAGAYGTCSSAASVAGPRLHTGAKPEDLPGDGRWERLPPAAASCLASNFSLTELHESWQTSRQWQRILWSPLMESELWTRDVGARRRSRTWRVLLLDGSSTQMKTPPKPAEEPDEFAWPRLNTKVIRHDLARTLPSEELFREKDGKGQQSLFRILRALAVHLWDIGYVQSLNFVVATLIVVQGQDFDVVFRCAQALLFRHSLADFYRPRFPKLGVTVARWGSSVSRKRWRPEVRNGGEEAT